MAATGTATTTTLSQQQQLKVNNDNKHQNHLMAVERTLATMKATGGILRDGGIEINLAKADDDDETDRRENDAGGILGGGGDGSSSFSAADTLNPEILLKLQKSVDLLSSRHMLRLTRWLDALVNADNLTVAGDGGGALDSDQEYSEYPSGFYG